MTLSEPFLAAAAAVCNVAATLCLLLGRRAIRTGRDRHASGLAAYGLTASGLLPSRDRHASGLAAYGLTASGLLPSGDRTPPPAWRPTDHRARHRRFMLAALGASAVFLVFYLSRWALFEPRRFAGTGLARIVYLAVLFPHMVLAALVPFVAVGATVLGETSRLDRHRRLVRWGWPLWLFVSVSGVVVYGMLYHWPAG